MRTVAILGEQGQLGQDCRGAFEAAGYRVVPLNHDTVEVSDGAGIRDALLASSADVVVNTAAMHNVEACEADPSRAFAVNGIGARNVAMAAEEMRARLLHISTDYVFDGAKGEPYTEEDCPRPANVYGNTKLSGEYFVISHNPRGVVVRTSGLYGSAPCRAKGGLNFVQLMLKLARERGEVRVVTDEVVTPTYTKDLARQLVRIAKSDCSGVVHATSGGECSWYEFAAAIFELTETRVSLREARSVDFPAKVRRPTYSVLENRALQRHGLDEMPHWRNALERYLKEIGEMPSPAPTYATR